MIENSAAGLQMLAGEVTVAVTREEDHQPALARYAVAPGAERQVAVELGWCAVQTGKYRGEGVIEVRLDGRRIGELTYLMSQRYAAMLAQVPGRPGCAALVRRGAQGTRGRAPAAARRLRRAGVRHGPRRAAAAHAWPAGRLGRGDRRRRDRGVRGDLRWQRRPTVRIGHRRRRRDDDRGARADVHHDHDHDDHNDDHDHDDRRPETQAQAETEAAGGPEAGAEARAEAGRQAATRTTRGCVPIASDVDCPGGSGNGPAYAPGPVRVIGTDIYDLDRDGDGEACE